MNPSNKEKILKIVKNHGGQQSPQKVMITNDQTPKVRQDDKQIKGRSTKAKENGEQDILIRKGEIVI